MDFIVALNPMDCGDYADAYFSLAEQLEKLLKPSVDLITDKSLSNPYFIESVNEKKTLIYEFRDIAIHENRTFAIPNYYSYVSIPVISHLFTFWKIFFLKGVNKSHASMF